ncbi:MAG: ATP-binding protein, partial [Pseudomonadota bacterium]
PVAVRELFANFDVEYGQLADERGLDLRIMPSSLWVRTDKRMMRRLLQNLISNAVKYTNTGRVLVGAKRRGDDVLLIVADSGAGIAEEHQRIIFKEFRRLDHRASDARGLGLGLSIVERISMLLSADVRLQSEPGVGSLFWVRASRTEARATDASTTVHQGAPGHAATVSGSAGIRVVCIDNEPAILEGMRTLLGSWGCDVFAAADTASALAALEEGDALPDIIFADYHLDESTGDEAIREIRAACGADIPGVIITADHSPERERAARDDGFSLLRKPVKAAAVRALINQVPRVSVAAE